MQAWYDTAITGSALAVVSIAEPIVMHTLYDTRAYDSQPRNPPLTQLTWRELPPRLELEAKRLA